MSTCRSRVGRLAQPETSRLIESDLENKLHKLEERELELEEQLITKEEQLFEAK